MPTTDIERPPTFNDLESKVCNLACLGSMVSDHVQNAFEGNGGAYRFTESEVNTLLFSVFELHRQIEAFKVDYYAAWHAEIDARKAVPKVKDNAADDNESPLAMYGPVRTAWRAAMSEHVPNLSFAEMSIAYDILHSVSEGLRDVCDGRSLDEPGRKLIDAIQVDVSSIRCEIGEYCIDVAEKSPSDDPKDQQNLCDAVALSEASFDPAGNGDLIAAIGARLVKKNRKAEAKRKAVTATVTAKAA